jgi:hypothetical protein
MFSFCPHCGGSVDQEQQPGQSVVCIHCRQPIGSVPALAAPTVVDQSADLIRQGVAARCRLCGQLVELRDKIFARHFAVGERKLCAQSGKPYAMESGRPAATERSPFMTREVVRVVACRKGAEPRIEELTLEYLDIKDRVRLQMEGLRDILGPAFSLSDYPPALGRTGLAVWTNAAACAIGKVHGDGAYRTLSDAEIAEVVDDLRTWAEAFFE